MGTQHLQNFYHVCGKTLKLLGIKIAKKFGIRHLVRVVKEFDSKSIAPKRRTGSNPVGVVLVLLEGQSHKVLVRCDFSRFYLE